jgi:hypothetical protein
MVFHSSLIIVLKAPSSKSSQSQIRVFMTIKVYLLIHHTILPSGHPSLPLALSSKSPGLT